MVRLAAILRNCLINPFFSLSTDRNSPFLSTPYAGGLTEGDNTLCAGLTTSLSTDSQTYTLLISVHIDTDGANEYNRVIGIAQLKAFNCANNY